MSGPCSRSHSHSIDRLSARLYTYVRSVRPALRDDAGWAGGIGDPRSKIKAGLGLGEAVQVDRAHAEFISPRGQSLQPDREGHQLKPWAVSPREGYRGAATTNRPSGWVGTMVSPGRV